MKSNSVIRVTNDSNLNFHQYRKQEADETCFVSRSKIFSPIRGHLTMSVVGAPGERSGVLLNTFSAQENLHNEELSCPKCH